MTVNSLGRKKVRRLALSSQVSELALLLRWAWFHFQLPKGSRAKKHQPLLGNQRGEWNA